MSLGEDMFSLLIISRCLSELDLEESSQLYSCMP